MNNLVFVFCQKAPLPVPAKSSSLFAKLCKFPFSQLTKSEKRLTNSVFVSRFVLISVFTPPFSFSRCLRLLNTFPSAWLFQHSTFNFQLSPRLPSHSPGVIPVTALNARKNDVSLENPDSSPIDESFSP